MLNETMKYVEFFYKGNENCLFEDEMTLKIAEEIAETLELDELYSCTSLKVVNGVITEVEDLEKFDAEFYFGKGVVENGKN